MLNLKRAAAVLLALSMLAALTACGTAETETDESAVPEPSVSGGAEAETEAAPETAARCPPGTTTIGSSTRRS